MREINGVELHTLLESERPAIVDARSQDYFAWETISGAINLPWRSAERGASKLLPRKKDHVVVFCQSVLCDSSHNLHDSLLKLGYENLSIFTGGIAEWKAREYATASDTELRVASTIFRFPNQEFYGEQVGSYLIELESKVVLIDGPQQLLPEHEDFILSFGKPIEIFLSHDSTGGAIAQMQSRHGAKIFLHQADRNGMWLTVSPDVLIKDGHTIEAGLSVIHTPGHTPGSICIYDEKNRLLFSGDHLSGNGRGDLRPFDNRDPSRTDKKLWNLSNKRLSGFDIERILPFHFSMIESGGNQKILGLLE